MKYNIINYTMEVLDLQNCPWTGIFKISVTNIFLYLLLHSFLFFLSFFLLLNPSFVFHLLSLSLLPLRLIWFCFCFSAYFIYSFICMLHFHSLVVSIFIIAYYVHDFKKSLKDHAPPLWYRHNNVRATVSPKPFTSSSLTNSITNGSLLYQPAFSLSTSQSPESYPSAPLSSLLTTRPILYLPPIRQSHTNPSPYPHVLLQPTFYLPVTLTPLFPYISQTTVLISSFLTRNFRHFHYLCYSSTPKPLIQDSSKCSHYFRVLF